MYRRTRFSHLLSLLWLEVSKFYYACPEQLTADHEGDARIAPMHGYKFAATSQHNAVNGSGVQLVKVVEGASHETGESISVRYVTVYARSYDTLMLGGRIEEDVIKLGFMAQSLGIDAN